MINLKCGSGLHLPTACAPIKGTISWLKVNLDHCKEIKDKMKRTRKTKVHCKTAIVYEETPWKQL